MGIVTDKDNPQRLYLQNCTPHTPMTTIPRWRSRLRGAPICSLNSIPVHSMSGIKSMISDQHCQHAHSVTLQLAQPLAPTMTDHGSHRYTLIS
jgi:hypothetical protein